MVPQAGKSYVEKELTGEALQKRVTELRREKARTAQKAKHLARQFNVFRDSSRDTFAGSSSCFIERSSYFTEQDRRTVEIWDMRFQQKKAEAEKAEAAARVAEEKVNALVHQRSEIHEEAKPRRAMKHTVLMRLATLLCMVTPCSAAPYAKMPLLMPSARFELRDGHSMPVVGLGVYMSKPGKETYDAVKWALEAGYRMIDTAAIYQNEDSVGEAIADSGVPRNDIFLTTKLWDADHGYDAAVKALETSLSKLKVDYLDLYLIHSPNTGKIVKTWDALIHMQKLGKLRSIGVSNFGIPHLEALKKYGRPMPAVNQIEMHPMNYQERVPVLDFCNLNGVQVQAYGSMFFGRPEFLERPEVTSVVRAHGATSSQVLLRWALQMGFQIIPKSVKKHRIEENLKVFDIELTQMEMDSLSSMKGKLDQYWQPLGAPVDVGDTSRGKTEL
ncbi:Uncharacterized oxidoreductase MSMEG_2408/MSMEI_2347 [Durusdinium trenchii]|uniref:Uncharacterized oxidoreductase MSMEG_2408/MSMEI_2347 n=2 Tax=Durusdinium trenchii TaxID=1381693 RepID=A0ABP0H861_9DINO